MTTLGREYLHWSSECHTIPHKTQTFTHLHLELEAHIICCGCVLAPLANLQYRSAHMCIHAVLRDLQLFALALAWQAYGRQFMH